MFQKIFQNTDLKIKQKNKSKTVKLYNLWDDSFHELKDESQNQKWKNDCQTMQYYAG